MIIEIKGNIFDILHTSLQGQQYNLNAIVNPVNCVGVMGDGLRQGLALEFKNKYPEYFKDYVKACKSTNRENKLGVNSLHYYKQNEFYIISFPTKYHWKDKSWLYQITDLLQVDFIDLIYFLDIKKIVLPYLGCGLGQIDKENFKTELYKIHDSNEAFQNIEIYLVEYDGNK